MKPEKRIGPGRPPSPPATKKIPVSYKLPRWLVEWLREQDRPSAQLIEEALRQANDLSPPNDAI